MQERSLALGPELGGLELAWLDWGEPDAARTVVCVHGLTRNAHDFDVLAAALAQRGCRVLAIDVAGRGRSGWLADPSQYAVPVYAAQIARLLELLELARVDWIGTSMGGLIGMVLAAGEQPPMARLVINDIGPFVAGPSLAQIRSYLGLDLLFPGMAELEAHLRLIHASFGPLTDAQWRHLARHSSRATPEGLRLHYDPRIREPFLADGAGEADLWEVWDRIRCPTLVLHGAESVLLAPDILERMRGRGPAIEVATFPGVGHAPALMAEDQIGVIVRWLGL
jgi:pimeloyl-ACP methyl ester carboxylesterase